MTHPDDFLIRDGAPTALDRWIMSAAFAVCSLVGLALVLVVKSMSGL